MTSVSQVPEIHAVLCDLGLAWLMDDPDFQLLRTSSTFQGTTRWSSPESLCGSPRNIEGDVWSWAWLTWEVREALVL